jgi:hypothetical protein
LTAEETDEAGLTPKEAKNNGEILWEFEQDLSDNGYGDVLLYRGENGRLTYSEELGHHKIGYELDVDSGRVDDAQIFDLFEEYATEKSTLDRTNMELVSEHSDREEAGKRIMELQNLDRDVGEMLEEEPEDS